MVRRPRLTPELRAEKKLEYVQCHAIGHLWDPIPVDRPPSFGSAADVRCMSCTSVRRDIASRVSGDLLARYYDYPEDYHDYQRHDKAWWRAAWLELLRARDKRMVNITNENARNARMTRGGRPLKYAPTLK
jgi:hypothetical protein